MPKTNINGYSMHYTDRGKGTAILFVHPPVLTSSNFQYQIQELSDRFRTVAFDIRGHGQSEPSKKAITYPLIAEDMRQLMDELKIERAFLCGYSIGGSIVLDFLLAYPDRSLGGIIIGGMSEVGGRELKNKISLGHMFSKLGLISPIAFSTAWSQAHKNLSLFWTLFNDARKGNAKNAEQYYNYSLHYNCTAHLQEINHRVLLIYGEKDKLFYPYARLLHERLPQNELIFIEDMDHRIPTKAAKPLNRLISQFVSRLGHDVMSEENGV
ncbi:alpha/beta fold hydrolase [Paenibacillus sp. RC21]|uniref:alpha/beta fold hydrolase n=1 Tax=Paenibacillus sp. RC21 TaxID=3156312 RepID=UPI0038394066